MKLLKKTYKTFHKTEKWIELKIPKAFMKKEDTEEEKKKEEE